MFRRQILSGSDRGVELGVEEVVPPSSLHSPQVTEVMRVCGENIGLIAHHWIMANGIQQDARARSFFECQLIQQRWDSMSLVNRPLERALNSVLNLECSCSALGHLLIKSTVLSGSRAEGLAQEHRQHVSDSASDTDYMVEFGPVEWVFQADQTSSKSTLHSATAAETQDNVAAPRLTITEASNPGFVLLLQERRSDCQHQQPLPFRPEDVKRFYRFYQRITLEGTPKMGSDDGPACSHSNIPEGGIFSITEVDLVPCLHVPVWWISKEFFTRRRRYSWPPKSARDDIRRYGLHLVAKGAPGSITQRFEWRISFSRAELIISLYLTLVQKGAVVLFKSCKVAIGEKSKPLKSYYVKTALLWLCEETRPEDWTSVHQGVLMLVDYLDAAVREKNLPCYFLSRINLFRFVGRNDLRAMRITLETIRDRWMRLLSYNACTVHPVLTAQLMHHARRLSEDEVRVHLMRYVIRCSLLGIVRRYLDFIEADLSKMLPMLLRSYPSDGDMLVLRRMLPGYSVQTMLYSTLTMAPPDLAAKVFQSLSGNSRDGFVWDAAPLLGLLTEEDLKYLLWDPDAVRDYLRRQRRLPAEERLSGLPADLRSPRDLCDLLLNIPLLVQVINESVPVKLTVKTAVKTARFGQNKMHSMEEMRKVSLHRASQGEWLSDVFHSKFGVDQTSARRAACRYGVEMRQLCDSAETLEEHKRIGHTLPDAWRMQHLVFDRSRAGHTMYATATGLAT